jgi:hypothetical protein
VSSSARGGSRAITRSVRWLLIFGGGQSYGVNPSNSIGAELLRSALGIGVSKKEFRGVSDKQLPISYRREPRLGDEVALRGFGGPRAKRFLQTSTSPFSTSISRGYPSTTLTATPMFLLIFHKACLMQCLALYMAPPSPMSVRS